jgi:choline dehydrogenase
VKRSLQSSYDYIVVGAGSAGCAAAYRLAEQSTASVLLVESGGSDRSLAYRMPIGFALLMADGKRNWNYHTRPEEGLAGRSIAMPRGRVLGGCSSINGMVYIRGQREDFDGWAEAGNDGWSYDDVLPLFKRSENHWRGGDAFHGGGGPLRVDRVAQPMAVADAFIEAAAQCGIARNRDFNGAKQEGVGYFEVNIHEGVRQSSARAFLDKHRRPGNLTVLAGFDARRIGFQGTRATSVVGCLRHKPGQLHELNADQEIILAAGAYNSPKLLELSGIGDAGRLSALGIAPLIDLPAVGENLQDHCNNYVFFNCHNATTYFDHVKPLRVPVTALNYLLRKRGIFANPAALAGAFFKLKEGAQRPDTQVHFAAAASRPDANGKLIPVPGICASICRLQPESRGSSHIRSGHFDDPPVINTNFLSTPGDCQFQIAAIGKLREIMATSPIAELLAQELPPLAGLRSQQELLTGIRNNAESVHHPVGTCRMGVDEAAVVTPDLRVRGVESLRIADASIMPRITSGNTHAACVMIGEKLAQLALA